MSTDQPPERLLIVGAGLIGTSVGLAARAHGIDVALVDRRPDQARLAADLGAGNAATLDALNGVWRADLALVCVPPGAVAGELLRLQDLDVAQNFSDVASIKSAPLLEAKAIGAHTDRFVGGHPMAGRERGGPAAARGDLFVGRPWVLTPTADSRPDTLAVVDGLARACGAVPLVMDAAAHDEIVALVSHVPQLLASVLASRLAHADAAAVGLGGQGLRDVTRIAESDPVLWAEIAVGNAAPLAAVLATIARELTVVADLLAAVVPGQPGAEDVGTRAAARGDAWERVRRLIAEGNTGRARLPGKHGSLATPYASVQVVIADQRGVLARLLADAGRSGVNVEDLRLDHTPGAPVGVCELLVRPEQESALRAGLAAVGWSVHAGDSDPG